MAPKVIHLKPPFSDADEALRQQYFALRVEAFERRLGSSLYAPGPDAIDGLPDTGYYMLVNEEGKLLAGGRVHIHPANSDREFWFEEKYPSLKLSSLLSTDITSHTYAELGGGVAAEGPAGAHYGNQLFSEAFKRMEEDYPEVEFGVGNANSMSFKSMMIGSMLTAKPVWYIKGQVEKDPKFNVDLRLLFLPNNQQGIEFLDQALGERRGDARSYTLENSHGI